MIELIKNDFNKARNNENVNVVDLPYNRFLVQKPSETFVFKSVNSIAFIGGLQVDLIDSCGEVVQNIDNNFAYESFIDGNGNPQIYAEFGFIGVDYWTKTLYLKITDFGSNDIYYSNPFLITDYNTKLSSRFDVFDATDLYKQSFRIANCFDDSIVNEQNAKQYTTTQGLRVNYKKTTTFLRKFTIDSCNNYIVDRFYTLFSYDLVFINSERYNITDIKFDERVGTSNLISGEFVGNPQNETLEIGVQILPSIVITTLDPFNGRYITKSVFDTYVGSFRNCSFGIELNLNVNPIYDYTTQPFVTKIYKDGSLFKTINNMFLFGIALQINFDVSELPDFVNGEYRIEVLPISELVYGQNWNGINDWIFTIADADYDNTEYDNTEYLTN